MKLLLAVLLVLPAIASAGGLYVKPRLLKMYENASRTSSIISVISQGEEVTYLKKIKGMYVLVKHENVQGWVVKHSISKKRPKDIKRVNIFRSKDNLSAKSQRGASIMSSGGVARSMDGGCDDGTFNNFLRFIWLKSDCDNTAMAATNINAMVFGEFEVKLIVPKNEKNYKKQYESLERIMNGQTAMSEAKDFIK